MKDDNEYILKISDLKVSFRTDQGVITSVDGANLSLSAGQVMGLVGESGCGKTVLSLSVTGLLPPSGYISAGSILFEGDDLTRRSESEMARIRGNRIAMIFQDPLTSLNPVFSIEEQMTRPLMVHRNMNRASAREKAVEMLEKVGIPGAGKRISEYPHNFSGGQRQRIMIATALSLNPALLIADEPTTALDVSIQAQILNLLRELKEEFNTSMIFISHDLGVISSISHRVAVMYAGWIVETAETTEIFSNPSHPYTRALLQARPRLEGGTQRLVPLPGQPPSTGEIMNACRLYPRCPERIEGRCDREIPDLYKISDTHSSRCFLVNANFG